MRAIWISLGDGAQQGKPAYTGTITVRYLRPTRLGALRAEAGWSGSTAADVCGRPSQDRDGVTVEAEGVFISDPGNTLG